MIKRMWTLQATCYNRPCPDRVATCSIPDSKLACTPITNDFSMFNIRRIFVLFLLLFAFAIPVSAQEGDPKTDLTKELWCPVCNGIRLDVCEQKVCEQMRDMIDADLAAGKSPTEIKADFIDLYGPVVLGEPPREGFNLIAWIAPVLLLIGGIATALVVTRRWSQSATEATALATATAATATTDSNDEYLARVERELSDQ